MTKNEKKMNEKNEKKQTDLIPLVEYGDLMDTSEVCGMIKISRDTLYKWVERKFIPHYKISGKKILFNRQKISVWLESMNTSL